MVKITRNSLVSLGALLMLASGTPAQAGPYIYATNVSPICKVEADGTVSSVSVTLNTVTASFYGSGLYYHFVPGSGPVVSLPSPTSTTGRFAVPAGTYNLSITTNALHNDPSATTSPDYPVTVPANLVIKLGSRKMCKAIRLQLGTKLDAIKKF